MEKGAKMKARILDVVLRVVAVCGLLLTVACSADISGEYYDSEYITAFGTIAEGERVIVSDNGVKLHISIVGNQTSEQEIDSRVGRVLVNYTILGNNPKGGFDIRLNRFYPLEIKDMVFFDAKSDKSAGEREDWKDEDFVSLLEAPTMPYDVSIGGGYVNVNVCYSSTLAPEEHLPEVTLYYDADSSTADTALLQLVGESEALMYFPNAELRFRWFSFRITEEIEALIADTAIYAFHWCWWAEEGNPLAGTREYTSVMNSASSSESYPRFVRLGDR